MHKILLKEMGLIRGEVQFIVVWIDMLPDDDWKAAQQAAEIFADHPSVPQFHDPLRLAGQAVAASLGAPGRIAWDIYLLYPSGSRWGKQPPQPTDWTHQMSDGAWAGAGRYHAGEALHSALAGIINSLPGRN